VYRTLGVGDSGEIEVLYRVAGRGTALLAEARSGMQLCLVGPLGRGFALPARGQPALLVGGGTGIASLYALAETAQAQGEVRVLLGARSAELLLGARDFEALGVSVDVATEDGSRGWRGRVTERLEQALRGRRDALVYACGPTPMMRRAAELTAQQGQHCLVSLENPMACGFGVCLGCAVPRRVGGFALVCREGPVFDAASVDWERLA